MAIARSRFTLIVSAATVSAGVAAFMPIGAANASPPLTLSQAESALNSLNSQADAANEAYDAAVIAVQNAQQSVASATNQVTSQESTIAREERGLAALAASAYRTGGSSEFVALVTTNDPSTFIDQATSLDQIAAGRTSALLAMRTDRKRLSTLQQTERDQVSAAESAERNAAAEKASIQALQAKASGIVDSMQASAREEYEAQQQAAANAAAAARNAVNDYSGDASGIAKIALQAAYAEMGKPYQYGGAGPDSFDCSGLTMWSFAKAGVSLPHDAAAQYGYGMHVSYSELEPGDLVFFDEGGYIGHVGIYVGNGDMIDAPHSGSYVGIHALYPGFVGGTRL